MKRFKKTAVTMLSAILVLSGCGTAQQEEEAVKSAVPVQQEEVTSERIVFKLSSTLSPEMVSIKAIENFSKKLKEETDGAVEIQIYPSSQLGGQTDQYEAFKLGNIEMCLMASGIVSMDVPEISIFGRFGLFDSSEHVENFYNSDIFSDVIEKTEEEKKIRILGLYHEGIRNMWFNNVKVEQLSDLGNTKLRVPILNSKNNGYASAYGKFGAETVPMNWEDCYSGLQSGVIDGVENNVEMIVGSKLTEFIDYELETEHCYSALFLLINENAYNRMNDEQKEIFDRLVEECNKEAYENFNKGQQEARRKTAEAGIVTIKLSEEDKDALSRAFINEGEDKNLILYGENIYDEIESMK